MTARLRAAFTLVELLVVIAMIALLLATILPAIQAAREMARRSQCQNNVGRLILAVQSYEGAQAYYPAGVTDAHGPIENRAEGMHHGWIEQLLPYMDERAAFGHIDFAANVYDPKNAAVRRLVLPELICPTDPQPGAHSSYAGCQNDVEAPIDAANHGVFFLNSHLRAEDITDGLAYTLFIGERQSQPEPLELGWTSGTRATLRNAGTPLSRTVYTGAAPATGSAKKPPPWSSPTYVGGFGSDHPSGAAAAAMGDGAVRMLSDTIDQKVLQLLANRADGQLINPAELEP